MPEPLYFDNASTTRCWPEAAQELTRFSLDEYGNPSSAHALGQNAARVIREARVHFAKLFRTEPDQVIFTGSGSESDNLAISGVALHALSKRLAKATSQTPPPRVIVSAIEHAAVMNTALSLRDLGFDVRIAPVDEQGQIVREKYEELLTPETVLVSIHQVNNILGAILPVEELARIAKQRVPEALFHTDAIQAFGKVGLPVASSPVDLVSLSAHKIHGPKGVGALIVLNRQLLRQNRLRPLIFGGDQESGLRSGTQSPGLISAFHVASGMTLSMAEETGAHVSALQERLRKGLRARELLREGDIRSPLRWNSPASAVPHIVSLSATGFPSGPLARLLEERGCMVSTGSACSSLKAEPDPVLSALGLPKTVTTSMIRISFSRLNRPEEVDSLIQALDESLKRMSLLTGGKPRR